ncbi:DUF4240 domain-containing protein [Fimbriiglobus ruber]|uniref:DUF4240 domain-containing protein n=1 Tax=Fimbriiglobus ruber TaxID=1908690 RepID=A0A225DH10_9BACT|nr:DUF4240 domain-containing protein [Fimbriiglobus ruber]OWK36489.1 hypothetical protein FRUB_09052 [Fimbriiglobus ruber]
MTQDEFWQHIRATRRLDSEEQAERLANRLAKLPVAEILAFGRWWHLMHVKSRTWKLWGAAYLINGGCSDDGFEYFRSWLILQGRKVFEAAMKDPETLRAVLKGDAEVEADCEPAYDAYCTATGNEDFVDALRAAYPKLPDYAALKKGWDFDDEEQMRKRYPKLFAAYLADD